MDSKVENLIDISTRPNFKELAAKGGRVRSDKKKAAAKQAWIMKKLKGTGPGKLKPDDVKWLVERVKNREVLGADMLKKIEDVFETCHPMQKTAALNTMKEIAKFIHGEKIQTENLNVNVHTMAEDVVERIMKFKESQKEGQGE